MAKQEIKQEMIDEALHRFNGYWANDYTVCQEVAKKYNLDFDKFRGKVYDQAYF